MKRIWQVAPDGLSNPTTVADLQNLLLKQRGLTENKIEAFFRPKYERDVPDPNSLTDIPAAVERIYTAVKAGEKIIVYGDYDADGVSSTAILVTTLRLIGANVSPYLPHRVDDGYGLSGTVLTGLMPELDLLITVDCGISNVSEIATLKNEGIDTIIVDHHEPPAQLPAAVAIVHPRHPQGSYSEPWLCGAGVAWKVAQALLRDKRSPHQADPDIEKWLLDLAILGTIADVVPLLGENRVIVQFGLEVLKRTRRPGLRALLMATKTDLGRLTATDIAFKIIPRLNAAGRMDHPQPALDLLMATTPLEAEMAFQQLERLNTQRQIVTRRIVQEAAAQVVPGHPVIFVHDPTWPSGIVGLAAGRLADKWQRPAIVVGSSGTAHVGSARSPGGVHMLDILRLGAEHLEKVGGHAQAAGFTVKAGQIAALAEKIQAGLPTIMANAPAVRSTPATASIPHHLVNQDTLDMLFDFAPWGEANPQPMFVVKDLPLTDWRPVGKDGDHIKFTWQVAHEQLGGIGFGLGEQVGQELKRGRQLVDVLAHLEENEFRGRRSLQLQVVDIVPAGSATITE